MKKQILTTNKQSQIALLLETEQGKEFLKEKMFLTEDEVLTLQLIEPALVSMEHGTPAKYAFFNNIDGLGMSYFKFKELFNQGAQLVANDNVSDGFLAVAVFRLASMAQRNYINALTNVAFEDAVKNKNAKSALQLLQMSVNEFKKNYIQTDDGEFSTGGGKLEITFAGGGLSDKERLEAIDEELKKDIE